MPFPNIIVGPASLFTYERDETVTIAAASALTSGDVSSANEVPDMGIDGATRISNKAYNLSVVFFGAYDKGGLACTLPPTNYSYTPTSGHKAIKAVVPAPAFTLAVGLLIDDALAAVAETPLGVRNGTGGNAEIVAYYEPSAKAITRAGIASLMTGQTIYGYKRIQFAETSGDTNLTVTPTTTQIQRNAGNDLNLVTSQDISITASLLASGKVDLANFLNGIATKSGGLKTKPSAAFGLRGLGSASARPVELVVPGDAPGVDDSIILLSASKQSDQPVTKTFSKTNPSAVPVTFQSADDTLLNGVHGKLLYFAN